MNPNQTPAAKKAKKIFLTWLIVWLGAWPLAFAMQLVLRALFSTLSPDMAVNVDLGTETTGPLIVRVVSIISNLLGLYLFVGWVPALISWLKVEKARSK